MSRNGGDAGKRVAHFNLSPTSALKIQKGDITRWFIDGSSDAIVNPANERMLGGGGADGAIHQAAGPELRTACYDVPEVRPGVRCPTGEARITPGFKLPASHVIHTVGPIYDANSNVAASLSNAYRNSLRVARENNIQYVAFSAISCGVFGYPFDEAATVAISTIKEHCNDIKEEILKSMSGSPPIEHSHGETTGIYGSSPRRPCDFCNKSTAILYCRADTAKLCLSCDREVHSTNQLFTKHTRSLLCDACDSSPASIFCSTDAAVHCQNCDWEAHNKTNSNSPTTHDRRPLEGFTGCPSVSDLLSILGFEDSSKKGLLLGGGGDEGSDSHGSGDGFPDYLVWETPSFVSLDDLIVSNGSDHNYQAMGVPPLPKNRNAALGTYKDELVRQLRELAKSEPNMDGGQDTVKPVSEFQPTITTENIRLEGRSSGFEHKLEQKIYSSYESNTFQWCHDGYDAGGQEFMSDQLVGENNEINCVVPDEKLYADHSSTHANANNHEGRLHDHTMAAENVQLFPVVREINSQERETAISRYKEKKKSRRYDKHIRYESRKVRAESRTRIRGRFAKLDQ